MDAIVDSAEVVVIEVLVGLSDGMVVEVDAIMIKILGEGDEMKILHTTKVPLRKISKITQNIYYLSSVYSYQVFIIVVLSFLACMTDAAVGRKPAQEEINLQLKVIIRTGALIFRRCGVILFPFLVAVCCEFGNSLLTHGPF